MVFSKESCHGALANYITTADPEHFQPMNVNFGLLPPLAEKLRPKKLKKAKLAERALEAIHNIQHV